MKDGFDPSRLYQLVYTAKDPLVLGIGFAATRDIVDFFRHATADPAGTANPVAGRISHGDRARHVAVGELPQDVRSPRLQRRRGGQGGRSGGILPYIAGRQLAMNIRFASPGGAAGLYEAGSEPALWWGTYTDAARGRRAASLLDRCTSTKTCPKVIEAFGATEFWGLRMSPGLVGTAATEDIALPADVRRYYMPGTDHGGGSGGVSDRAADRTSGAALAAEPQPDGRHASRADRGTGRLGRERDGPAAEPVSNACRSGAGAGHATVIGNFPRIPGVGWFPRSTRARLRFRPGVRLQRSVRHDRASAARDQADPPDARPAHRMRMATRSPASRRRCSRRRSAPISGGTSRASGFFKGQMCGFAGGYVPFALTRAEREKSGDPRRSIEERYGTQEGYACAVRRAAEALVRDRFLLREDADRQIAAAAKSPDPAGERRGHRRGAPDRRRFVPMSGDASVLTLDAAAKQRPH